MNLSDYPHTCKYCGARCYEGATAHLCTGETCRFRDPMLPAPANPAPSQDNHVYDAAAYMTPGVATQTNFLQTPAGRLPAWFYGYEIEGLFPRWEWITEKLDKSAPGWYRWSGGQMVIYEMTKKLFFEGLRSLSRKNARGPTQVID